MERGVLFLTGFEPFLEATSNPSGELARALQGEIVGGVEIHSCVLPVSYRRMPGVYAAALESLPEARLVALCSLGLQRESYFRLESRARPVLHSQKPDVDGVYASQLALLGTLERRTTIALEPLAEAMGEAGGLDVRISNDAGGYLCEHCYWEVLGEAARRAVRGVFLHVPPFEALALDQQLGPVRTFLEQLASGARGPEN